jgi:hypothetical protein
MPWQRYAAIRTSNGRQLIDLRLDDPDETGPWKPTNKCLTRLSNLCDEFKDALAHLGAHVDQRASHHTP